MSTRTDLRRKRASSVRLERANGAASPIASKTTAARTPYATASTITRLERAAAHETHDAFVLAAPSANAAPWW